MFDASNRQACRVRGAPTSTPLHALTTLNDPTWIEAARNLAQQVCLATTDRDDRLRMAFRRVIGRVPGELDLDILRRALQRQLDVYAQDPAAGELLLKVGASTRDEQLPVAEHAAYTAVSLAILNLDEALSRE
jgi:hypothetical protein